MHRGHVGSGTRVSYGHDVIKVLRSRAEDRATNGGARLPGGRHRSDRLGPIVNVMLFAGLVWAAPFVIGFIGLIYKLFKHHDE